MKTLTTSTLIATLALMISLNLNAGSLNLHFEEEAYVNDIPFNTEMVIHDMMMPEFDFEEEAYINDIPFDTECVAKNCIYMKAIMVDFEMEEEAYVDDIPFDTPSITIQANYSSASSLDYNLEDEEYINDIPFNTETIVASIKLNEKELYVSGL
jgi:hypothetical protein